MTTPLGLTPIERKYAFAPAIVEKSAWRRRAARVAAAVLAALRLVPAEGALEPAAPAPPAVKVNNATTAVRMAANSIRGIIHLTLSGGSPQRGPRRRLCAAESRVKSHRFQANGDGVGLCRRRREAPPTGPGPSTA
jgi:hypothetical protein